MKLENGVGDGGVGVTSSNWQNGQRRSACAPLNFCDYIRRPAANHETSDRHQQIPFEEGASYYSAGLNSVITVVNVGIFSVP